MSMGPIDISAGGFFDPQEIERQRRVAAQWAPFLAGGGFGGNAKAEPMPTPQRPQEVQGPGQQAPAAAAPVKSAGLYGFEQDQKRGPMEFGGLGGTAGQSFTIKPAVRGD